MKHSTFISLTAAASLAACHDATAPEQRPETKSPPVDATAAAAVDSSAVWVSVSLDDAGTRLTWGLPDGKARIELKRALNAASLLLAHGIEQDATRLHLDVAARTLGELREQVGDAAQPDLDAIALAIDAAASLLSKHQDKQQ